MRPDCTPSKKALHGPHHDARHHEDQRDEQQPRNRLEYGRAEASQRLQQVAEQRLAPGTRVGESPEDEPGPLVREEQAEQQRDQLERHREEPGDSRFADHLHPPSPATASGIASGPRRAHDGPASGSNGAAARASRPAASSPAANSRRPAATCARPGPRESRRAPAVDWLPPSAATSVAGLASLLVHVIRPDAQHRPAVDQHGDCAWHSLRRDPQRPAPAYELVDPVSRRLGPFRCCRAEHRRAHREDASIGDLEFRGLAGGLLLHDRCRCRCRRLCFGAPRQAESPDSQQHCAHDRETSATTQSITLLALRCCPDRRRQLCRQAAW